MKCDDVTTRTGCRNGAAAGAAAPVWRVEVSPGDDRAHASPNLIRLRPGGSRADDRAQGIRAVMRAGKPILIGG